MRSATELYHVPLARTEYVLGGDFKIPLRPGLLSTYEDLERQLNNTAGKVIRLLGTSLHLASKDLVKIKKVVQYHAQLEWYQAKGSVPGVDKATGEPNGHQKVLERYNLAVQEANTVSEAEQTGPAEGAASTTVSSTDGSKIRAGTRPYCRSLIDAGEADEKTLLAAVNEKFPDKVFKIGDVRGCLRNAGKLDWTKRKGAKKSDA